MGPEVRIQALQRSVGRSAQKLFKDLSIGNAQHNKYQ